ncbi:MAG: glycerophosphodiester phosphodiesterase [Armatimonadetes bacterium]|nr:glycerophosphodiester phosphodiesterase [Armatimonadota bacterium]
MQLMAHRGASGLAPENTLAAFRLALDYQPDWFELDVHATADGEIVVMHDATVDRTTNGTGAIAGLTLAEIRGLDAGSWKGAEFAGEPVPLLAEVVELAGDRVRLNVEIKGGPDLPATAARVVDILRAGGVLGRSEVSSFDLSAVKAVQALTDEPALALITSRPEDLETVIEHGLGWLNLHYAGVSADLVARAHAAGVGICAWTINDLTRWDEFKTLGVDIFCTDLAHQARPPPSR